MIRKVPVIVMMVLLLLTVPGFSENDEEEMPAVISAEKWLSLVDSDKYKESWKEAAALFTEAD